MLNISQEKVETFPMICIQGGGFILMLLSGEFLDFSVNPPGKQDPKGDI